MAKAIALAPIAEEALASGGREDRRTGSDRHHVTVVVDATTLAKGDAGEAAECHIPNGPALPVDTVCRLCCDGAVSGILEKDERVLSVGRRTRAIPPSIRRALLRRDAGCRFPGCTAHRYVDGHHIRHRPNGRRRTRTRFRGDAPAEGHSGRPKPGRHADGLVGGGRAAAAHGAAPCARDRAH